MCRQPTPFRGKTAPIAARTIAKTRESLLCAYVNLNNLTDYTGWSKADSDQGEIIHAAAESCVKLDPNVKQLPGQRLGND